ncbi:MAG: hypothetical protein ACHREM_18235, partial [Polyangiales bacterium]
MLALDRRAGWLALLPRALLTLLVVAPYGALVTMRGLIATDDFIYSDILSGELPGRALIGQMLRAGELPLWTEKLCGGIPLHAAGAAIADPIGVPLFVAFSPAHAVNLYILALLLIAAHGTYSLATRLGASVRGALLASLAFAHSGYVVCQLKHLSIIATICWVPTALALLDRALGVADPTRDEDSSRRARLHALATFA